MTIITTEVRMKKTFTLLALGGLTLVLLAFAFVSVQAKPEGSVLLQATATTTASANGDQNTGPTAQASANIVVWDQFCVRKVPYTLIAISENASFEILQEDGTVMPTPIVSTGNSNEVACESVGVFRDKQVVVCRGPQLFSFPISVSGDGGTEEFLVPLGACPGPRQPDGDAPTATPAP
jgi:hypothetical protein